MSKRDQDHCAGKSWDPDSNRIHSTWQQEQSSNEAAKVKTPPRKNKIEDDTFLNGKNISSGDSNVNVGGGNRSNKKSGRKAIAAGVRFQTTIQNGKRLIGALQDHQSDSIQEGDGTQKERIVDLILDLQKEVRILTNMLTAIMEVLKVPKDERLSEGCTVLLEAANVIEHGYELGDNEVVACEAMTSIWNDVTSVITRSLQNEDGMKYTAKKASLIKLENGEAGEMCHSIINAIVKLLDLQGPKENISIAPIPLFTKSHYWTKMLALLRCLGAFLAGFGFNVQLQEHICRIVSMILVPILEFDLRSASIEIRSLPIINVLSTQVAAMDCVVRILRWNQYSSALLAPQMVHVDSKVVGQHKAGYLKENLLVSIVNIINTDDYLQLEDTDWLCRSCQCLTTILENMNSLNGKQNPQNRIDLSDQIQIANIYKWVQSTLQCKIDGRSSKGYSLWWYSLDLLKTVVRLHPKVCAQYWSLFLPQETSYSPTRTVKGSTTATVNLISIMSLQNEVSSLFSEEKVVATLCCKEIVDSLPLNLWSQSGYLAGRIESSLIQVIRATTKHLSAQFPQMEREATYSLAVTIFTKIPYEKYVKLKEPAIYLIDQMGKNYSTYGLHGGLGLEAVVQALIDCMGGQETPNGEITLLPLPTFEWLNRPLSALFVSHIFNKMTEISSHEVIEKGVQTKMQMNLFVRVIRSATWILVGDLSRLDALVDLTRLLLKSEENVLKVIGAALLSAFITGRKASAKRIDGDFPLKVYAYLDTVLTVRDSKVRCSSLKTLSLLEFNIWKLLLVSERNPLRLVLPMALEYSGDPDAKVRSEACKALGNIMTVFMHGNSSIALGSSVRDILHQNIEETIQVAASAMEDSDATVRSMALFAIGNIAFDTAKSEEWEFVKLLPILQLCDSSYNRLFDDNEKVINNAIRTTGHLFHLADLECCDEGACHLDATSWASLCSLFLQSLGSKISRAIKDVTDVCDERSWKQRMNSKKQAWGACQTFIPILKFAGKLKDTDQDAIRNAILQLIYCVEYAQKTNEKITIGAANSLSEIGKDMWESLSGANGIRGLCLAACLANGRLSVLPFGVKENLHAIILNILPYLDDYDIVICLKHNETGQEDVEYLYGWMVDNDVGPFPFEAFGRNLSNHSLLYDVSLTQKFQSRAIYEARKRRRSVGDHNEMLESGECSDEDEL